MKTLFNNKSYIDESDKCFCRLGCNMWEEPLSVYHEMTFFCITAKWIVSTL